jgi:ferredoxin-NADP reductase/ferredoxin
MLGLFRKKPREVARFAVTFQPGNTVLELKQGDNLLEAALKQGVQAPYNCRVGACKTCQVRVTAGQPKSLIEREYVFTQDEIAAGAYLACQTSVQSDMEVEWHAAASAAAVPELAAQLVDIRKMTPRIRRVQLRMAAPLSWRAGQFARLSPAELGSAPRCYSMVAAGQHEQLISFDITHYPDGEVSSWMTNPLNIGKTVFVEAPLGEFGLPAEPGHASPLLCIAGGSGIGAIGGIIAGHARKAGPAAPVLLVYGSAWQGRRGYVAEHLPLILAEAAQGDPRFRQPGEAWKVLLCGPSPLVDTSIDALRQYGMQPGQMAFDKYEQRAA